MTSDFHARSGVRGSRGGEQVQLQDSPDPQFDPRRTALVVVDMQNDFCHPEGRYATSGRDISPMRGVVPAVNRALKLAQETAMLTVFMTLVYDAKHPPIEERHELMPLSWRNVGPRVASGSWGSKVVDELRIRDVDLRLTKHAYSSFEGTELEARLRERNVTTVLLCGVTTNVCILATAFDAFDKGFDVCVLSDAVAGYDEELSNAALGIVDNILGRVLSIDELIVRA